MKFCVIGLGRFGYHVAVTLADNGMEVIAVDCNESIIASIRDKVTQAICMRVIDEEALRTIGAEDMDTVIVAMGENFAESILVTALLKQKLRVSTVITRSISEIHRDILQLIGADQVILPEREVGRRLAETLSLPFKSLIKLSKEFCIGQIDAPASFIGQEIGQLAFFENYSVLCIGHLVDGQIQVIPQDYIIAADDQLIIAGAPRDVERVAKLG